MPPTRSRHATHGRVTRRGAVSGPLVVGQVALSLVLVVGCRPVRPDVLERWRRATRLRPGRAAHGRHRAARRRAGGAAGAGRAAARGRGARAGRAGRPAVSVVEPMSGMGWNGADHGAGRAGPHRPRPHGDVQRHHAGLVRHLRHAPDRRPRLRHTGRSRARRWPSSTRRSPAISSAARTSSVARVEMETGLGVSAEIEIVGVATAAAYRGVRSDFPRPCIARPRR